MSRSLKKASFINKTTFLSVFSDQVGKFQSKCRSSTISPELVGKTFLVGNGKSYSSIIITDVVVGKKFGELVFTRTLKAAGKKARK